MSEISSSQIPLSTQQPIVETVSDLRGGAAGNLTNVRNSAHQPASVNNSQSTAELTEGQFIHLQNFVRQGLGSSPEGLMFEGLKNSKIKKSKSNAIRQEQAERLKSNATKFIHEFLDNGVLTDLTGRQENIINNKSFINDFKLNVGFADFLLQDNKTSNIIGEHLYLFVKAERGGYVSSEDVPYDTPVSTNQKDNTLVSSQLSEGALPNPDDVKSHDNNAFPIPGTNGNNYFDDKEKIPHPEGATSNTTNVFNNINNDNRVFNNYPIYNQNNFNFPEPEQNDVSPSFQPEKIFVAGYDPAQKTATQYLTENLTSPGEQNDGVKNIVKNLKAVTDVGAGQQLSESNADSVDQPDGLSVADNFVARQENDGVPETAALNPVVVPKSEQSDSFRDKERSFNEEVTKRPHSFAVASTDAHAPAAPDAAQQPSVSASESRDQIDGARGGNSVAGDREAWPAEMDAAEWPFMSGSTAQTDGVRGGNPATASLKAESAMTDAAQSLSGSPARQTVQKGGYQQVTENGKTSWVKVGQGNPPLFLSDGGRSYRGMIVPSNSTTAAQPGSYSGATDAANRASVNTAHQAVQTDNARGSNPATGNREARAAVLDAAKRPSGSMSGSTVQTDDVRDGNPATGNREVRSAVLDAAKRPSGNMSGSTVQTDGARGGNPATASLKAESATTNAAQPLSGSPARQPVQKGGYQQVTENGKTSWVKVGQGNPPLFLSDGGRSYRGMIVPNKSTTAAQPGSYSGATDAANRATVNTAHQAVQTDGARGNNPATGNRATRATMTDAAQRLSVNTAHQAVQTDGVRDGNPATATRKAESATTNAAQQSSVNTARQSVQTDNARGNNPATGNREARAAVLDAAKRPSGSMSGSTVQTDDVRDGNPATGNREVRSAVLDAAKRPSGNMSGSTVQTDGARGGNPATASLKAESATTNAAQPLSGSPARQPVQKGGYQQVTENGKTSWVKVGQGNPPLFLSDGGRSYRGMIVPSNSTPVDQPGSYPGATDAANRASVNTAHQTVQTDDVRDGNPATDNRKARSATTNAAQQSSVNTAHQTVQTDDVRDGNPATGNREARPAVLDAAKRPSGSMSGSTVQTDGVHDGNPATANREARSAVTDAAKRPSGNMSGSTVQTDGVRDGNPATATRKAESATTNAAQPLSGSPARQAIQKGGYQQVTENGKTSWVKVGQGNPPLFLSDGGRSYRGMIVPNKSTTAAQPTARQSVQTDNARGSNPATGNREVRSAVLDAAKRPSGSIARQKVPTDDAGVGNPATGNREARSAMTNASQPLSVNTARQSVQTDNARVGNPATASREARAAVLDAAKRPSGSIARQKVPTDNARGGNPAPAHSEARSAVTNAAQPLSESTSGSALQNGPWQQVIKNGKTVWVNERQGLKVSLSEAGITYRRMNIPNVKAKNFN